MNPKNKILLIVSLLFISKLIFAQFYIEPKFNYQQPLNLKNNSIWFYNQFTYKINSEVKKNKIDTIKINMAQNFYYGINFGYKIKKDIDIFAGYEFASSKTNYKIREGTPFVVQNFYYENHFDYYKEFRKTSKINIDLNYLHLYKLGLCYSIPFDNLNIFGSFSLTYTKLKLSITTYNEDVIYKDYDSLLIYHVDTGDYSSRSLISESTSIVKDEYFFNNNINYNINIGVEFFLKDNLSLLFKAGYQNNKNSTIYKNEYYSGVLTNKIFTEEQFFFPSLNFCASLKFNIDFKPKKKDVPEKLNDKIGGGKVEDVKIDEKNK